MPEAKAPGRRVRAGSLRAGLLALVVSGLATDAGAQTTAPLEPANPDYTTRPRRELPPPPPPPAHPGKDVVQIGGMVSAKRDAWDSGVAQATPLGAAVDADGHSLPAYALDVMDERAGKMTHARPAVLRVQVHLAADQAAGLAAWYAPDGWLLVPRGWLAVRGNKALVAQTFSYLFAAPGGTGHLVFDDWGDDLLGSHELAPFFPEAAKRDASHPPPRTTVPIHKTPVGPHMVRYQARWKTQYIEGLALYQTRPKVHIARMELALPEAQRSLAEPVLHMRMR